MHGIKRAIVKDLQTTWVIGVVLTILRSAEGHSDPATVPVRLSHGSTHLEGLVEVYHDNVWGHVCDDGWDNKDCQVVCRQLEFSGGEKTAGSSLYGPGGGVVWLTQVDCRGTEPHLGLCMHEHWGTHNCDDRTHTEDAGCRCQPGTGGGDGHGGNGGDGGDGNGGGTVNPNCIPSALRITAFDSSHPGIGRVEVKEGSGWGIICDDFWDDIDAAVFCKCKGFTDPTVYRAYWSRQLLTLSAMPFVWDAIHCKISNIGGHIGDCEKTVAAGRCSSSREAAAVACTALPQAVPPPAPDTTLTCDGYELNACFRSQDYTFQSNHLKIAPSCANAPVTAVSDGVCMNIKMELCQAATLRIEKLEHKEYCYNVTYSPYSYAKDTLLMDSVWARRACCLVGKNGKVSSSFKPQGIPIVTVSTKAPTTFTLQCFLDEHFTGPPLAFPATVTRGQDVYCRVTADTWDEKMFLVVPNCRFANNLNEQVVFNFLNNKCPKNDALGVSYFSFDGHNWGFKFHMPKFQGYDDLYLMCDSYVCDYSMEAKPYCDRSCSTLSNRRRRRSITNGLDGALEHKLVEVQRGPFHVEDHGVGPILLRNGLVAVPDIPIPQAIPTEKNKTLTHNSIALELAALMDSHSRAGQTPTHGHPVRQWTDPEAIRKDAVRAGAQQMPEKVPEKVLEVSEKSEQVSEVSEEVPEAEKEQELRQDAPQPAPEPAPERVAEQKQTPSNGNSKAATKAKKAKTVDKEKAKASSSGKIYRSSGMESSVSKPQLTSGATGASVLPTVLFLAALLVFWTE